jgi:two-component sensor histidine kinase
LRTEGEQITLRVYDDSGIGFPEGFDFRTMEPLGLQLVGMMTGQLGGTLTLTCEGGTAFPLGIPYGTRQVKEDAHAPCADSDRGR